LNDQYILNHVDQKNKYIIKFINFYKSHTLIYQLITRVTPPKIIPELIKSIFVKKESFNNYDQNEKEFLKIDNFEIDKMDFLKRKDYAYLYSNKEFDEWGKKAITKSLQNLNNISDLSKSKNIKLNILYLYEPILLLKKPDKKLFNYLISELKKLEDNNVKVNFIKDIYDDYVDGYEAYKNLFFIHDIHWNKKGNFHVAEEILKKVRF